MVGDWDDGERERMGMGMSVDGDKVDGDGWGWGQIPVPVQLSNLKRLSSVFTLSSRLQDNVHVYYLQEKAQVLQPHERHGMLLLDKIYVNLKTTFNGGSISGLAVNSPGDEASADIYDLLLVVCQ